MITITFKIKDGMCSGFDAVGHAGYGPEGYDIVCAAVSALTQGTISAIKELSSSESEMSCQSGNLRLRVRSPDKAAMILLAGLETALQDLQAEYGAYLTVCHG